MAIIVHHKQIHNSYFIHASKTEGYQQKVKDKTKRLWFKKYLT